MRTVTLGDYKQRLLPVLVYIQAHLDEPLPLDLLASHASFSPFHFHRVFRGMIGESVAGHVRRLRLERAASRLRQTRQPVTQLAFEAGYTTHEAFTRAFRAAFGISPSEFRARNATHGTAIRAPSGVHYAESGPARRFRSKPIGGRAMEVAIKAIEPMRVAFARHVGPYDACGEAWDALTTALGKEGWLVGATFVGICHDDPEVTPPERVRYDACVTVDDSFEPSGEVGVQSIPGGDYAVAVHIGPYSRLGETYARVMGQWLPRSGRELRATPCFEVYVNDPESTPPDELITEIHVPLEW